MNTHKMFYRWVLIGFISTLAWLPEVVGQVEIRTPSKAKKTTPTPTATATPPATTGKSSAQNTLPPPTVASCSAEADTSKYGFEKADDLFWVAQKEGDSQAITAVSQSTRGQAKVGCYALALLVELLSGHPNKSKGEAYVDFAQSAPPQTNVPADLENAQIKVWVFVPKEAAGPAKTPNGLQVFVEDEGYKREYGSWFKLQGENGEDYTGRWVPITLMPSKKAPLRGFMAQDFEPKKIAKVGVKIAAADGSKAEFRGFIYVDGVDW